MLILAPIGRDAELLAAVARGSGYTAAATRDLRAFLDEVPLGLGAAVVTEEALQMGGAKELAKLVDLQPEWSDLPFIVIVSRADPEERAHRTASLSKPLGNVTILERPLRPTTVLSAYESTLRDRRRQYALRDVLAQYQALSAELEKRVQKRTEELTAANKEMEGFTYSVSHDLRAPLRAIASTSMIIKQDYGHLLPPAAIEQLDRQNAASKKLAMLIDDLLQLSRLSRAELRRLPVNLTAIAQDIASDLKERGLASHVDFRIEDGLEADGDPTLLRLAFANLMENAVKFSPKGGCVEIGHSDGTIFVRDCGIGFDPAYSHKIFLPFERLVTDDQFPGTGIGLANVERIVRRHGGRIWVDSEPGKGSTFYLSL